MLTPQFLLPLADELIVDNFAGGGGAAPASATKTLDQYRAEIDGAESAERAGRCRRTVA